MTKLDVHWMTRAYAKLKRQLHCGRACLAIQRVYRRYRLLMKWREAMKGVKQKMRQQAQLEKQRRCAMRNQQLYCDYPPLLRNAPAC